MCEKLVVVERGRVMVRKYNGGNCNGGMNNRNNNNNNNITTAIHY